MNSLTLRDWVCSGRRTVDAVAVDTQAQEQYKRDLGSQHQIQGLLTRPRIRSEVVHYVLECSDMRHRCMSYVAASLSLKRIIGTPGIIQSCTAALTDN